MKGNFLIMVCKQNYKDKFDQHITYKIQRGVGGIPISYAVVIAPLNKLTKISTHKIQQPWATSGYVEIRCSFTQFDNQINMNLPGNERYLLLNKCFINEKNLLNT